MEKNISVKEIGFRIKWLCHIHGNKAADISEYLGLESVQSVYKWMAGKSCPTIVNLYLLSCMWNVSLDFLISGRERHNRLSDKYYLCVYEQMLWQLRPVMHMKT